MTIEGDQQTYIGVKNSGEATKPRANTFLACVVVAWALLTIAVPAAGMLMPFMFLLGPSGMWVAVVAWIAVPLAGVIVALRRLWVRRYRSAAVWCLVPVAGVVLAFYGIQIGDIVDFWLNKAQYDRVVSDLVRGRCSVEDRAGWKPRMIYYECQAPAIAAFEHDGMLSTWRGFVYDATDEIAKPQAERSAAWKNRDIAEFVCDAETRVALGDHYYIVFGNFGGCD